MLEEGRNGRVSSLMRLTKRINVLEAKVSEQAKIIEEQGKIIKRLTKRRQSVS